MPLHWHADGRPVKLHDDWEASVTAAGGFEQLTASADRDDVKHLHQGSGISAVTSGGREVWFGHLDATPATSRLPVAHLTATGPVAKLRRMRNNWLAQARDYGMWKPQDSEPYNYGSGSDHIQPDSQGGRILFRVTNGTDIKLNNQNGLAAWFPGESITNIAFSWDANVASTDHKLQIFTGAGPSGTLAQQGGDISVNATSGTVNQAITSDKDLIVVRLTWISANTTTTAGYRLSATSLRVNGRSSGDTAAPGEIIGDMASTVGLGTFRVETSGQNALPFYWEGGSWAEAFSELAALDDWPWLVNRKGVSYGPWDDTWHLYFSQENEDLDFPPIYNRVRVFYTTLAGAPRSVRVEATPDPLAKFDVDNEYQYDLGESYPDDDVPTAVGNALLERLSKQRVVGTVNITHGHLISRSRVWTPRRRFSHSTYADDHYLITPGGRANLDPYPKVTPQRITGVRLRADGITVEFGDDAESAAARVLARVALQRTRGHKRRKKK
jgi:hypothetical protein